MRTWTRAFTLQARAKLNTCLHVGPVQPNGLHEIRSFTGSLELADKLEFEPHDGMFSVVCEGVDIPERENLVYRAAAAVEAESRGVRVHVHKRIPVQAGLGGASADAATALLGIARVAAERADRVLAVADFDSIASGLGSDVPACLEPGFKSVRGTGEIVSPAGVSAPPWGIALLKPAAGMPTPAAYRLLDDHAEAAGLFRISLQARDESKPIAAALAARQFDDFCAHVHNDFDAVIRTALPDVARCHERLLSAGARVTLLCGSGSTVAGFFSSKEDARSAVARIALAPGEWSHATGFSDG